MPFICIGPVCIPWTAFVPVVMYLGRPIWNRCGCRVRLQLSLHHSHRRSAPQAAAKHAEAARRLGGSDERDRAAVPRHVAGAAMGPGRMDGQAAQADAGCQGSGGRRRQHVPRRPSLAAARAAVRGPRSPPVCGVLPLGEERPRR